MVLLLGAQSIYALQAMWYLLVVLEVRQLRAYMPGTFHDMADLSEKT
jgi:hypothetical protein